MWYSNDCVINELGLNYFLDELVCFVIYSGGCFIYYNDFVFME